MPRVLFTAGVMFAITVGSVRGQQPLTIKGHLGWIGAVAFSPDGKTLASGCSDNILRLCDAATGQNPRLLKGHSDYVDAVAFSPDGKFIATGSYDKTARLWEISGGHV